MASTAPDARNLDDLIADPTTPDELIAERLATLPFTKTITVADGSRRTYDPAAGLWFDDTDLVAQARRRAARRRLLGSPGEADALTSHETSTADHDGLHGSPAARRADDRRSAY